MAEDLLYPVDRSDRPIISYKIEDGSVQHIFKTSLQYIIGFNAVLGQINQVRNIDFLEHKTAKAFETIQDIATKKSFAFTIKTSLEQTNEVVIDSTSDFHRTASVWVNTEFYFYGKVTNAGGKDRANIHISTDELGTVRVQTPIRFLEQRQENLLYKTFGVRAVGKQHVETGEIDTTTLKFLDLVDYVPEYNEEYLKSLRASAKKTWLHKINPEVWLQEIRGGYGA